MLHLGPIGDPSSLRALRPATTDWPARFVELAGQVRLPRLQAFYRAGVVPAETPLAEVPMIALDLETTGLDPERDGIVSIGALPLDLERIRASETRHWIVRPRVELDERAIALHGITHSDRKSVV